MLSKLIANLRAHWRLLGAAMVLALISGGLNRLTSVESPAPRTTDSVAVPPAPMAPAAPIAIDEKTAIDAFAKIEPRLNQFAEEATQDLEESLDIVDEFFTERRRGAKAFSAELLSYWGKFQHVRGYFETDAHDRYIQECFNRHIFKPEELTAVIESAVSQFVSKLQARENKLLVDLRADLGDEGLGAMAALPSLRTDEAFRRRYEALIEQVAPALSRDIGVEITKELLDWRVASPIVMRIGSGLAARLGVSGAILSGGAYAGPASLGISVVVSLLVDRFLDWVFRQVGHDPEAQIAAKVEGTLDELEAIVMGESGDQYIHPPGMEEFWKFAGSEAPRGGDESPSILESMWSSLTNDKEKELEEEVNAIFANGVVIAGGRQRLGEDHKGLSDQLFDLLSARTAIRDEALYHLINEGGVR